MLRSMQLNEKKHYLISSPLTIEAEQTDDVTLTDGCQGSSTFFLPFTPCQLPNIVDTLVL